MSLHQAIVVWLNHLPYIQINQFQDLTNPLYFNRLLNKVDQKFFPLNLSMYDLVNSVNSYRENIDCQQIEYIDIGAIQNNKDLKQLEQLFQIVLDITIQSPLKGEIIKPILQLDQQDQEILMHFLQKIFDKEESQTPRRDENWLIDKIQELERQNLKLINEIQNYEMEQKENKNQIKLLNQTIESKEKQIKEMMEQIERRLNEEQQTSQEDQLRVQILSQERKLTQLELQLQDYKQKEQQMSQVKQENESLRQQLSKMNKLKKQLEWQQEKRDQDKESYNRIIDKNDQDLKQLKNNLKNILNQLSQEKEKQLNNELLIQRQQAIIENEQQENKKMQENYEYKVKELENLIELLKQENQEQELNNQNSLDQDMLSRRFSYSKDNVELEYYRKENHKLEQQYKQLKKEFDQLQLDQDNNNKKQNLEVQILSQNQLNILHDQLKRQKEMNQQLKKQLEEHNKSQKRYHITDLEISVLQQLTFSLSQIKIQQEREQEQF